MALPQLILSVSLSIYNSFLSAWEGFYISREALWKIFPLSEQFCSATASKTILLFFSISNKSLKVPKKVTEKVINSWLITFTFIKLIVWGLYPFDLSKLETGLKLCKFLGQNPQKDLFWGQNLKIYRVLTPFLVTSDVRGINQEKIETKIKSVMSGSGGL